MDRVELRLLTMLDTRSMPRQVICSIRSRPRNNGRHTGYMGVHSCFGVRCVLLEKTSLDRRIHRRYFFDAE